MTVLLYGEGGKDYPDNDVRFGVFSRAVLGIVRSLFRPDILHCHDWQAALVPVLMREKFRLDPTYYGIKVLLTIHNLGYQGIFPPPLSTPWGCRRICLTRNRWSSMDKSIS